MTAVDGAAMQEMRKPMHEAPAATMPALILLLAALTGSAGCKPQASVDANPGPQEPPVLPAARASRPQPDLSGRAQVGVASAYADKLAGKAMADGNTMDPHGDNAASKTLPLGTTAKVTNLETGRSAVVTIEDRGPYVKGRIVDLSPATAKRIGITPKSGVAKVKVAPISIPLPDGGTKPGIPAAPAKP
jgi:rare lipoprotein A